MTWLYAHPLAHFAIVCLAVYLSLGAVIALVGLFVIKVNYGVTTIARILVDVACASLLLIAVWPLWLFANAQGDSR